MARYKIIDLPEFAEVAIAQFNAMLNTLTTSDRIEALRGVEYCSFCGKPLTICSKPPVDPHDIHELCQC